MPRGKARRLILLAVLAAALSTTACTRKSDDGPMREAYRQYRTALEAENLDALKKTTSGALRKNLDAKDASDLVKQSHKASPAEVEVFTVDVSEKGATLYLRGTSPGGRRRGLAELVREGNEWKVASDSWYRVIIPDPKANILPSPTAAGVLAGHQDGVSRLAYSLDGRWLVSISSGDYSVRVWSTETGKEVSQARAEARPCSVVMSPDGSGVLVAIVGGAVWFYPLDSADVSTPYGTRSAGHLGQPRQVLAAAGEEIAASESGLIAAASYQKPITIWRWPSGSAVRTLSGTEQRRVSFSPAGALMASGGKGPSVTLWDTSSWTPTKIDVDKVGKDSEVAALCFSPDGSLVAAGFNDSSIVLIDVAARKETYNFFVRDASAMDVAFSPDGDFLATAQHDGTVYLWELDAKRLAALKGHKADPAALAFHPDGHELASGGTDRTVMLWRATGSPTTGTLPTPTPTPAPISATAPGMTEMAGQTNRVRNPSANDAMTAWRKDGEAEIAAAAPGNPCFSVRYSGSFFQDVSIPLDRRDGWAVLTARVASERINEDSDITGLPYLYGYMMNAQDYSRINEYLQGDSMRCAATKANEWVPVGGAYKIPPDTGAIRIFLNQASGGQAQNGSTARFDDVGIFLFPTETEAKAFLDAFMASGSGK